MAEQTFERAPCPHCAEPISVTATVCPFCRRSALLDLAPLEPVNDARNRYQIARRLVELGVSATLGELLKALERGEPVVRGATIQQAFWYREAFATEYRARLTPVTDVAPSAPAPPLPSTASHRMALGAALTGALLALGGFWLWRSTRAQGHTIEQRASDAAVASPALAALDSAQLEPLAHSTARALPTPQEIARKVIPSVVVLTCRNQLGTGFFVQKNTIVTNHHVTCFGDPIDVQMTTGERGQAMPTSQRSDRLDIAVLYTSLEGKPLPLASAGGLVAGDPAMVVGNPKGLDSTFHVGNISNPHRFINGLNYLQVDARINSGNSGGPLLDSLGRVVGVVSLKRMDAEGLGMALPIDYLWEDGGALLPAPPEHPSPGFQLMLDLARADGEAALARQAEREVLRLDSANYGPRGYIDMHIRLDTQLNPPTTLPFEFFGYSGEHCRTELKVTWRRIYDSDPRFADPNPTWVKYEARDKWRPCELGSVVKRVALLRGDLNANSRDLHQ